MNIQKLLIHCKLCTGVPGPKPSVPGERSGRPGCDGVSGAVPRLRQPAAAPALPRQRRGADAEAAATAGMGFIAVREVFMLSVNGDTMYCSYSRVNRHLLAMILRAKVS